MTRNNVYYVGDNIVEWVESLAINKASRLMCMWVKGEMKDVVIIREKG